MPSKKDFGKADAWLTEHHDELAQKYPSQHLCIDAVTLVYTVGDTHLGAIEKQGSIGNGRYFICIEFPPLLPR